MASLPLIPQLTEFVILGRVHHILNRFQSFISRLSPIIQQEYLNMLQSRLRSITSTTVIAAFIGLIINKADLGKSIINQERNAPEWLEFYKQLARLSAKETTEICDLIEESIVTFCIPTYSLNLRESEEIVARLVTQMKTSDPTFNKTIALLFQSSTSFPTSNLIQIDISNSKTNIFIDALVKDFCRYPLFRERVKESLPSMIKTTA